jgi:hypothetical protein
MTDVVFWYSRTPIVAGADWRVMTGYAPIGRGQTPRVPFDLARHMPLLAALTEHDGADLTGPRKASLADPSELAASAVSKVQRG